MRSSNSDTFIFDLRWLTVPAILLILSGLTVACGSALRAPTQLDFAEEGSSGIVASEARPAAPELEAAGNVAPIDEALANASVQTQERRVIIYTGDMSLIVRDTEQAVEAISNLANELGGHVASSNIHQFEQVPRGSITIRVPAENYQQAVTRLRELAVRVERVTTNTQDVTEEFVDLEARKANLEVTEEALQQLLEERQRVGSTSDILEVYRELTNIRGQIEQIEGRLRYLSNQAALSTITIELIPDVLSQPVTVAGWQPQGVAKEALQTLITALQGLGSLVIWGVVFILPLLLVIFIPLVILVLIIRWWWRRHKRNKESIDTEKVAPAAAEKEADQE